MATQFFAKEPNRLQRSQRAEVQFAEQMFMTLEATGNGIGLAATQVGILKRIIIINIGEVDEEVYEPLVLF